MAEFEKENMKSEMMQEMMGDAIEDVMDNDEEEEDRIVNQVLDEIGIDMTGEIPNAPEQNLAAAMPEAAEGGKVAVGLGENGGSNTNGGSGDTGGGTGSGDAAISDLEARLNNLKR